MYISSYFSDNGNPKTLLTPTIDIYRVSDSLLVISAVSMTEIGSGFYKYNFSSYDNNYDYVIICDGGSSLYGSERYTISSIGAIKIDLTEILEGSVSIEDALRLMFAVLLNKSAGGGTTTITFKDLADSKNRVSATVDNKGNRSAVVIDGT